MSDKYRMELRVCENCGGEYVGGKKSHLCPDCRRLKQAEANRDYQAKRRAEGGRTARPAGGGAYCAPLQETGGQIARATGPMAAHAAGNGTQGERTARPAGDPSLDRGGLDHGGAGKAAESAGKGVICVCVDCGAAFAGTPASKRCPECKAALEARKAEDAGRETDDEKTGWRNMFRDATGTVIVPGGNVMRALDDLCAYEEACEALGVQGPQQLRNLLTHVATLMPEEVILRCAREGRRPEPRKREASSAVRVEYGCRCCGSCGHFVLDSSTGKGTAGHCAIHPKMIRSGGGKKGRLVEVPGEFRKCFGAREACRDWTKREGEKKNAG